MAIDVAQNDAFEICVYRRVRGTGTTAVRTLTGIAKRKEVREVGNRGALGTRNAHEKRRSFSTSDLCHQP